jgi:hypothetical protein
VWFFSTTSCKRNKRALFWECRGHPSNLQPDTTSSRMIPERTSYKCEQWKDSSSRKLRGNDGRLKETPPFRMARKNYAGTNPTTTKKGIARENYMMLPRWCMAPVATLGLQAAEGGTDRAEGLNSARDAASAVGLEVRTLLADERGASVMGRLTWVIRRRRNSSLPRFVRRWSNRRPAAMSDGTRSRSWKRVVSTSATSPKASLTLALSPDREQHAPVWYSA